MNNIAYQAYSNSTKLGLSGRALEAQAFFQAAQKLQNAKDNDGDRSLVMEALRVNNNLWTYVQFSITEPNCALPAALQAELVSLSLFVDKRTREAIASPDPELLGVLIEINRNIALAQFSN